MRILSHRGWFLANILSLVILAIIVYLLWCANRHVVEITVCGTVYQWYAFRVLGQL